MIHYQIRKIHIIYEEIAYIYGINFSKQIDEMKFNNLKKAINLFGRMDTLRWFLAYIIDHKVTTFDADLLSDSKPCNTVEKLIECLELGKKYEWFVKYNNEYCLADEEKRHIVIEYDDRISCETYDNLEEKRPFFESDKEFNEHLVKNYKKEVIENYYETSFLSGKRINCGYFFRMRSFFRKKFEEYDVKRLLARINKIKFDIQLLDKIKPEWIIEIETIFKTRFELAPIDPSFKELFLNFIDNFQKNTKLKKKQILTESFKKKYH